MKWISLPAAAMAAIALAGCSGGDARDGVASNEAGDKVDVPTMADEPNMAVNQAETRTDEEISAPGKDAAAPAPPVAATETAPPAVPKAVRRDPQPTHVPTPAPKEEPADPHAGHDMANTSH